MNGEAQSLEKTYDDVYRRLKERGHLGWGGDAFSVRMTKWQSQLDRICDSEFFPQAPARILELGCGSGDSAVPLVEKGYHVVGVDISAEAIAWAKDKHQAHLRNLDFFCHNLHDGLPFSGVSYDAVVDSACLHCILPGHREQVFENVLRVLKPGGAFVISHMINDPRDLPAGEWFDPSLRVKGDAHKMLRHMPQIGSLLDEIRNHGFELVSHTVRENPWWDHAEVWCQK